MKRYLFTSPLRHWKNGDKGMAIKVYFLNIFIGVVEFMMIAKWIQRKVVKDDIARANALFNSDPDAWEAAYEEHNGIV